MDCLTLTTQMFSQLSSSSLLGHAVRQSYLVYLKKNELNVCSLDYVTQRYNPLSADDPDKKLSIVYHKNEYYVY